LNPSSQAKALAQNLDYVSDLIVRSIMRENLYTRWLRKDLGGNHVQDHIRYRDTLKAIYLEVLKFQATAICYLSKNDIFKLGLDMVKWDDWGSSLSDIKGKESAFNEMYSIWKDIIQDSRYQAEIETHERWHMEIINTAKMMATDFKAMKDVVSTEYANAKRMKLLEWLSSADVDPSKNFNNANDKRNADTGEWLLSESEEFKCWKTVRKFMDPFLCFDFFNFLQRIFW
jgi:hypothetical protein